MLPLLTQWCASLHAIRTAKPLESGKLFSVAASSGSCTWTVFSLGLENSLYEITALNQNEWYCSVEGVRAKQLSLLGFQS